VELFSGASLDALPHSVDRDHGTNATPIDRTLAGCPPPSA
jgi:hypothetical protein